MAYDAEHGRSYSLPVRLALTGGAVITGTPTSSAHYFDEMEEMARQEAKVRLQSGQKWREEDKAMLDEWTTSMREVWAVMRSAAQGDGAGGVMTLAPVTMCFRMARRWPCPLCACPWVRSRRGGSPGHAPRRPRARAPSLSGRSSRCRHRDLRSPASARTSMPTTC